jgi:hypothetical protein
MAGPSVVARREQVADSQIEGGELAGGGAPSAWRATPCRAPSGCRVGAV